MKYGIISWEPLEFVTLIFNIRPDYTENAFVQIQYPNSFIQRAKTKDFKIYNRKVIQAIPIIFSIIIYYW